MRFNIFKQIIRLRKHRDQAEKGKPSHPKVEGGQRFFGVKQ